MSIDEKVAEIFAEAEKAGREDIINAISPILTISGITSYLFDSKESGYTKEIASSLVRKSYTAKDVGLMSRYFLVEMDDYRKDFQALGSNTYIDEESRHYFIKNYLSMGYYEAALNGINSLSDKEALFANINENIEYMRARSEELCFTIIGEPQKWDGYAINIFNQIGYSIGDKLNQDYYPRGDELWSEIRFEQQVNGLGDYLESIGQGTPVVSLKGGQISFDEGSDFAECFRREQVSLSSSERIYGWNFNNFPQYLPVIATDEASVAIESMGGVRVSPDKSGLDGERAYINHGFIADEDKISKVNVGMAMTLLPLSEISKLLENDSGNIMLMRADSIAPSRVNVTEDMSSKMRWHRPQVIRSAIMDEDRMHHNLCRFGLSPMLYLRGVANISKYGRNKLDMRPGHSLNRMDVLSHFSTAEEKEFGRENWCQFSFKQESEDTETEKERFYKELSDITEYFGKEPSVVAHLHYPLFESLAKDSRKFSVEHIFEISSNNNQNKSNGSICGKNFISKYERLSARIGGDKEDIDSFFGTTPSEIISKSVRLKVGSEFETRAFGLLDNYPASEVLDSARTEKQIEFLMDSYKIALEDIDLSSKSKVSPKLKRKISRKMLDTDLEM